MPHRHSENYDPERQRRAIDDKDNWRDYRLLVIGKLDDLVEDMDTVKEDIVKLRIKSSAWGFAGGTIAAICAAILHYINRGGH